MDKIEASEILSQVLAEFRGRRYDELQALLGSPLVIEREAPGGIMYQIEVEAFWDDPRKAGGDIRLIASIDDGGFISSLKPLTDDFIMNPDGGFVDE